MAKKLAKTKSVTSNARKKAKVTSSSKKAAIDTKKKPISKKYLSKKESFTKTDLLNCLAESTDLNKVTIKDVLLALEETMLLRAQKTSEFSFPGLFKLKVIKKPATKARAGVNPFTKEPIMFAPKPARKVVKIKPLKKLKEAV